MSSFRVAKQTTEQENHDLEVCHHVMDQLRAMAQYCRTEGEKANHPGLRTSLRAIAILCESACSLTRDGLHLAYPGEMEHLEELTQNVIEQECTERNGEWRPEIPLRPDM